jgi:HD superfamily phosphohydrolase
MSDNNIEIKENDIKAKAVDIVGENQYKIANNIFNIDVSAPKSDTNLEHLEKALKSNRESLEEDIIRLEKLIKELLRIDTGQVQAVIKDILIGNRNIELLIPPIRLNGGKVRSLPNETNIVKQINEAIGRGIDNVKANYSDFKDKKRSYEFDLEGTMRFKFGRSGQEKRKQIQKINDKIDRLKPKIQKIKEFLEPIE